MAEWQVAVVTDDFYHSAFCIYYEELRHYISTVHTAVGHYIKNFFVHIGIRFYDDFAIFVYDWFCQSLTEHALTPAQFFI